METSPRTITTSAALSALALLVGASPAHATVTYNVDAPSGGVSIASDGAGDTIKLVCVNGQLGLEGGAQNLLPCTQLDNLQVRGNSGGDVIDLRGVTREAFPGVAWIYADGGNGVDVVEGSAWGDDLVGDELVSGNGGDDVIEGGDPADGGPGDDVITDPRGAVDGGPGEDVVSSVEQLGWAATTVLVSDTKLDMSGDNVDTVAAPLSSVEDLSFVLTGSADTFDATGFSGRARVEGSGGDDVLIGGSGGDVLLGGGGNDKITGAPGLDVLDGGSGDDDVKARDESLDRVLCGDGADTLVGDRADLLDACETTDLPPAPPTPEPAAPTVVTQTVTVASTTPPPPAGDVTAPQLTLSAARLRGRALSVGAACPKGEFACKVAAELSISGKRGARTIKTTIGSANAFVAGGMRAAVTRTLTAKQAAAVKGLKGRSVLLSVTVTDAAGNTRTQSLTAKLI